MKAVAEDANLAMQENAAGMKEFAEKMVSFFQVADSSGDGSIEKKEFLEILKIPEVVAYFTFLEVDIEDAEEVFDVLAAVDGHGDGRVSCAEFMQGLKHIKGQAKAIDSVLLLHRTKKTYEALCALGTHVAQVLRSSQEHVLSSTTRLDV